MNSYLYYLIIAVIVGTGGLIAGSLTGGFWVAALIMLAAALSQYDARKDCQNQIDSIVKMYENDDFTERKKRE